jgi:group I intron endonuclease
MASRNPTTRCGIYAIRCLANGKVYVGSSAGIDARWSEHRYDLNTGRHHSPHLQNAWVKYGAAGFAFEVIELVPADQLVAAEQRHIDALKACDRRHGFNAYPAANSPLGVKNSAVAAANRARVFTPETRAKHAAGVGKLHTEQAIQNHREAMARPESRAKMSEAKKKQVQTAETRAKRSASLKGRTFSPETIEKMRQAALRRGPVSEETRRKQSEARRGRVQGEETKAKRASSLKGRKPSEACVEAVRERWRKWRQSREEGPIID